MSPWYPWVVVLVLVPLGSSTGTDSTPYVFITIATVYL